MSCTPGKVQLLGVSEVHNEKVFVLRMLQGRNPDWVARPFFARYDSKAIWMDDLKPAFGQERFFFEQELELMLDEMTGFVELNRLEYNVFGQKIILPN